MKQWLPVLFCLLLADAAADQSVVLAALEGYEWSAARTAVQLGTEATQPLMDIVADSSLAELYRQRAVAVLGHYPGEEVVEFLLARLHVQGSPVARRRLVDTLCGFVPTQAELIEPALLPLLDADDPHLRVRVATCLLQLGTIASETAVEGYLARVAGTWEESALRVGMEQ